MGNIGLNLGNIGNIGNIGLNIGNIGLNIGLNIGNIALFLQEVRVDDAVHVAPVLYLRGVSHAVLRHQLGHAVVVLLVN
eukprot:CAMPEP_0198222448 /NCGR_PEP_ID=MMETSP1445-20131203/88150_1 /TAXON_ID=36898 /ORGANISM="Pyramimonas sp., Strain CCMP2087" /LENGTH=78 /DNA_ID=CAMNT_0043900959 /DNA_START=292 /DNA_END=528 /DNA_ORIENTATION=+